MDRCTEYHEIVCGSFVEETVEVKSREDVIIDTLIMAKVIKRLIYTNESNLRYIISEESPDAIVDDEFVAGIKLRIDILKKILDDIPLIRMVEKMLEL